ncbi:hypothetical protein Hanom_Chr16g01482731 [Helianthus anomalus]
MMRIIHDFVEDMWHNTGEATDNDIDILLKTLMPNFFQELSIPLV